MRQHSKALITGRSCDGDPSWQWAPNWLLLGLANQWGMVWLNMGHFNLLVVLLIAIWWQIASRVAPSWRPHPLALALFILLILIPSASCKALACLLLVASLWRRHQSGDERAVLQIVLAFTVAVLWGQQVFALLSGPVLALDARGGPVVAAAGLGDSP